MKKKRLIPFRLLPGSWGLVGQKYEEAEAAYYWDGEDLERKLVDIRFKSDPPKHAREVLTLDLRYGRIDQYAYDLAILKLDGLLEDRRARLDVEMIHGKVSEYDYARTVAELDHNDETERALAILEVDRKFGRVEEREYVKTLATLKKEPWVGVVRDSFDVNQGLDGFFFELDWNEYWIEYLRIAGYVGATEEDVIDQWFTDVCRSTAHAADGVDSTMDEAEIPVIFGGARFTNRDRGF